jgi:hypothetical protein
VTVKEGEWIAIENPPGDGTRADPIAPEVFQKRWEPIAPVDPPDCAFASPEDPRWEALGNNTARKLVCANCGEESTNPGQFLGDGRWVCTQKCRKELCDVQSYDDLAASGGIVDAP